MDLHLLLLRLRYASPETAQLLHIFLLVAAVLAAHQLWVRSSPTRRELEQAALRGGLIGLALCLGLAVAACFWGYQGGAARARNLQIAGAAPLRVAYGAGGAPLIQVFTAPGCGPCAELEARLGPVIEAGYAVEYLPSPLSEEDWLPIVSALCAPDPHAAFEHLYRMAQPPQPGAVRRVCDDRARLNEAALKQLTGRLVYPTVVPDGFVLLGAPSQATLLGYLHAVAPPRLRGAGPEIGI